MDIYLSVNNRAEVLRLPVLPPEFTVSKGRNNEVFDTVSQGQLKLIITIHGMWCLGITKVHQVLHRNLHLLQIKSILCPTISVRVVML